MICEVRYAAPSMNGRKIFGATVPYGQVWRIGDRAALSAKLELSWENTVASVPFSLDLVVSDREW